MHELSDKTNDSGFLTDECVQQMIFSCRCAVSFLIELSSIGGDCTVLTRLGSDICEKWFSLAGGFGKFRSAERNYTSGMFYEMGASYLRMPCSIHCGVDAPFKRLIRIRQSISGTSNIITRRGTGIRGGKGQFSQLRM